LYVRSEIELVPILFGGPQERSLRAGTENIPGIVGLGTAMDLVREHRAEEHVRLRRLRQYLVDGLRALGPGMIMNGQEETTAPHILSVSFMGADAEMLQIHLNNEGVAVSLGSACNSKSIEPSHVLTAMDLPREQIESTLRISLGMPTTEKEIDFLLETMTRALPRVAVQ
jgi:cysteine desulfurase